MLGAEGATVEFSALFGVPGDRGLEVVNGIRGWMFLQQDD